MKRFLFIICAMLLFATPAFAAEGDSVRVAVIDSGISTAAIAPQHTATGNNYVSAQEGTGDRIGHGTAIASLIVGSDTAEIPGMCPEATLVPLVFYTKDAAGAEVSANAQQVTQAIYDAIDRYRCRIINLSFCTLIHHDTLQAAVDYAEEKGVLIVASAGNWQELLPGAICYPGAYDSVICVGAAQEDGTIADFSLRNSTVDLLAQGIGLTAATRQGSQCTVDGTSYAAALVTGAAAQIWTRYPTLSADEVRSLLLRSTRTVDGWQVLDLDAVLACSPGNTASSAAFSDVAESAYYHDAVLWAAGNHITGGIGDGKFSPNASCTRAQTVTFLWRAAGSPEPNSAANPFTDVQSDKYYYKAVLWAVEQGITGGTSAVTFSPNATVTRGQTVTFLHRAAGSPPMADVGDFRDVASSAYYAPSVGWAVANGITNGSSTTTFAPDAPCTRGQIVTFLYRYFVK